MTSVTLLPSTSGSFISRMMVSFFLKVDMTLDSIRSVMTTNVIFSNSRDIVTVVVSMKEDNACIGIRSLVNGAVGSCAQIYSDGGERVVFVLW